MDAENAWAKAAACEAHARVTRDQKLQERFRKLRDSWIRIGNDASIARASETSDREHVPE